MNKLTHATKLMSGRPLLFAAVALGLVAVVALVSDGTRTASGVGPAALDFDGTNDYVTFGAAPALGASTFTLEAWVRRDTGGTTAGTGTGGVTGYPIIAKGRNESDGSNVDANYFLGITTTGFLTADFEDAATGANHPVTAITNAIPVDTTWRHVAATYGAGTWNIYLDGVLVITESEAGAVPRSDSIQHAAIGAALNSTGVANGSFPGAIDEARIWNVVRTQPQLLASKSTEILSATGLIGRWGMNEGAGVTIADSSGSGVTGTLTNGPLWFSPGGPVTVPSSPTCTACGIDFDGVNDHVRLGTSTALNATSFTLETWVKREGFGVGTDTGTGGIASAVPLITKGRAQAESVAADINYFFGIDATTGTLVADFEEGAGGVQPSQNHPVSGATALPPDGIWHHAAVTFDSATGTWSVYLDGVLDGTATIGAGRPPNAASTATIAALGTAFRTDNTNAGYFNGVMDEARIWNIVRTQPQIAAGMTAEIPSAAGLIGRWGMNEGTLAVAADTSGNAVDGLVTGGARWVQGSPFSNAAPTPTATPAGDPVLVGAGDISRCDTDNDERTAQLLDHIPGAVFTLGDSVYDAGTGTEFATCYDPTWGRHRPRTRPVAGNHDYDTANATPYFDFFNGVGNFTGPAGDRDKGYYSYDVGPYWHVVVLNGECLAPPNGIGTTACDVGSAQELWLRADLAANAGKNIVSMWHKPRFSSSGNVAVTDPLWDALIEYGAEINLTGHFHNYERLAAMDENGAADPACGMTSFIVGTGGTTLSAAGTPLATSIVINTTTWGVLKLTLHENSYDYEFIPVTGQTFTDSARSRRMTVASRRRLRRRRRTRRQRRLRTRRHRRTPRRIRRCRRRTRQRTPRPTRRRTRLPPRRRLPLRRRRHLRRRTPPPRRRRTHRRRRTPRRTRQPTRRRRQRRRRGRTRTATGTRTRRSWRWCRRRIRTRTARSCGPT